MSQPFPTPSSPEFAQRIMEQTTVAYASCHSYMDEGEVTSVFVYKDNRKPSTSTKPFFTAFVRPSDFRFEFRYRFGDDADFGEDAEWRRFIVWQGGKSIRTWSPGITGLSLRGLSIQDRVKKERSLRMAIAGASGVSSGSALAIPNLLMPDKIECNGILSLTDLELTGEEVVGDATAYKIQGDTSPQERKCESYRQILWIDTQTRLILQTFVTLRLAGFDVETTTAYRPQMNVPLPPEKLVFDPPVGGS